MNPNVEWVLKRPGYQRLLMLLAVIVLIVGLFIWGVFLPQLEDYGRLLAQSAQLQVKLDTDQRKADNLPIYKAEYSKMLVLLEEALKQLPNDRDIPELLTSISSRAKESGLNVKSFRPGKETAVGFYAEVPVSLKFEGSFHQVANFFYAISTLPRIVNINKVKIGNKTGSKTENNILTVDCLAITFRFLESTTGAGGKK